MISTKKILLDFASFAVMAVFAAADIITGFLGKDLVINDVVFNSFVIITLGSFGIDGATKIFSKKDKED
jgi:hypothetical protein